MSNIDDISKIEYAHENYDSIISAGKTKAYTYMKNGRNKTADTVLYEKSIGNNSYYVIQAVPDAKSKTLFIVSAFIGKSGYKKEVSQLIDAKSPDATSKIGSVVTSTNSISNSSENVNTYARILLTHRLQMGTIITEVMKMPHLTMEDFERARKRAESGTPLIPEEQKLLEDLGARMENLSKEELQEYLDQSED